MGLGHTTKGRKIISLLIFLREEERGGRTTDDEETVNNPQVHSEIVPRPPLFHSRRPLTLHFLPQANTFSAFSMM